MDKVKVFVVCANLFLLLTELSQAAGQRGIEGSPHDFSYAMWNLSAGVCSPCHVAHNTAPAQIIPLWSHATSGQNFTPYTSPTLNAGRRLPSGVSLACLSCHDGSLAINQFIWGMAGEEPEYIGWGNRVGPDLHATHPISFTYDAALAAADGGLEDPTTYHIGDPKVNLTVTTAPVPTTGWTGTSLAGKTIDQAMLFNQKMECSSCHDVHKQAGNAPTSRELLRVTGRDSSGRDDLLCRTCHIK